MTLSSAPRPAVELALLGLLALLWGSSYLFIKVAVAEIQPLTLIAIRVSVAALFLLGLLAATGLALPPDRSTWGRLLIQSFLNAIGAWVLLAWGAQHIDAGLAAVLNSTSPIFVFFLALGQPGAGGLRLAGAVIGLAGVVLIVGVDVLAGLGTAVAGQAAVLASALLYGAAALHGRRFAGLSAPVVAAGTMLWASAVLVPLALVVEAPWTLAPSARALGAALALGVACTGLALILYFRLVRTLGPMGVASQAYLRAGVGVGLGVVLLGETVTAPVAAGLAATILGVALINARRVG